nr:MAG TPA: stabilization protein [Caudoviricetes sp.]
MNKKSVKVKSVRDAGYNNIFISSLFRTLMPGETYRYGIVFYTKEGKRSNVHWIADIKAPDILEDIYTTSGFDGKLPIIGLEFSVTMPDWLKNNNISKYIIVRCKKRDIHTRILEQVTVSNVMRQDQ